MIPAIRPRDDPRATRLLHVDPAAGRLADLRIGDLRTLLRAGDLLVVNDAGTLPASLSGRAGDGAFVEARLAGEGEDGTWRAVLFGAGDWRARTEDRPPPPRLAVGDVIQFDGVRATVERVDERTQRLVSLRFDPRGAELWRALYRAGRPVQYSYAAHPYALWTVQTRYASRPWAVEPPSAGLALTWDLLLDLRRLGVRVALLTHAAGLSSTGDARLDARLPLAEHYQVPEETVRAVAAARRARGRVVAVGTTVTRALEGAASKGGGRLEAGEGWTDLRLGPGSRLRVVDGIVTGLHEAGTSHFELLEAFAPRSLLEEARALAEERGYEDHEFGDSMLVLSDLRPASRRRTSRRRRARRSAACTPDTSRA